MAIIPNDEQFVGVNSSVDMTERKSSRLNSNTQVYTLQDFSDSLTPDLTPITVDGNSVSIAKDPTATTQDTAVIKSTDTNAGIAIVPNGTGAITAQVPDGTAAGGNARGRRAVDLQYNRNNANQVASGPESFIAGALNRASGNQSFSTGYNNTSSGNWSFTHGAFNVGSSSYATISGGQSNTVTSGTHATVVGGYGNTSSGQYSVSGGFNSTASGENSLALVNAQATNQFTIAIGRLASSSGNASISIGQGTSSTGTNAISIGKGSSSGDRGISIGANADASSSYSISIGGDSDATQTNAIAIGKDAQATAEGAVAMGGNTASSDYSVVSGGQNNTASTKTHATVVGGSGSTSSGRWSISGGLSATASGETSIALGYRATASNTSAICIAANDGSGTPTASGIRSNVFGGVSSSATNTLASAIGGYRNTASGYASYALGYRTEAYLRGQLTIGENFSTNGDAQASQLVARKFDDLTTGGTTVLSLDGTGTTNLIIPNGNNRVWNVVASWSAIVTGTSGTTTGVNVGDVITQSNAFAFKKIGGTSSIVGSVTDLATHSDSGMSSASMGYSAGASQELALTFTAPTFTGGGSVTLRIVNKIMLTEVAY
jgi:hypothetical protein